MFTGLQHCSELHEGPLAQITKSGGTETLTYMHTDHLMTPRFGTNAAGTTVWTWDSGAFGKEVPTGTATVNLRFPGQFYDSETTLFYNWNRYYNPATGRYVSSDPMGIDEGLGTYNYVEQNPLLHIDPEGLAKRERFAPGFPETYKRKVLRAITRAKELLDSCKAPCCVTQKDIDRMKLALDKATFKYEKFLKDKNGNIVPDGCARADAAGEGDKISISKLGITNRAGCGCKLSALLAHEAFHYLKPKGSDEEEDKQEATAINVEKMCFGCKPVTKE